MTGSATRSVDLDQNHLGHGTVTSRGSAVRSWVREPQDRTKPRVARDAKKHLGACETEVLPSTAREWSDTADFSRRAGLKDRLMQSCTEYAVDAGNGSRSEEVVVVVY